MVGEILFRYNKVPKFFCNRIGTVHGGAIATWVDCFTSAAIVALDPHERTKVVSVSLATDYQSAAMPGQDLYFRTKV